MKSETAHAIIKRCNEKNTLDGLSFSMSGSLLSDDCFVHAHYYKMEWKFDLVRMPSDYDPACSRVIVREEHGWLMIPDNKDTLFNSEDILEWLQTATR